jgi:hypothetical protein
MLNKNLLFALVLSFALVQGSNAATIVYADTLSAEVVGGQGSGSVTLTLDDVLNSLRVEANWSGLSGALTNSHIHCCTAAPETGTAGVSIPTFLTLGGTSGTYDQTFDLTNPATWGSSFLTANGGTPAGAQAALVTGLNQGRAYLNLHTFTFGGGEIRGFPVVPEPATAATIVLGLGILARVSRPRRA